MTLAASRSSFGRANGVSRGWVTWPLDILPVSHRQSLNKFVCAETSMACMGARGCLACSHALPAAGPCGERCLLGQCQNLPTSWSGMWMDGVGSCTQPFSVVADTRGRRQCWWLQASRCRRPPGCGETRMVGVPRAVGGGWLPLHEAATGWPRSRTAALACVDDAEALMTASHGTKRDLLEGRILLPSRLMSSIAGTLSRGSQTSGRTFLSE